MICWIIVNVRWEQLAIIISYLSIIASPKRILGQFLGHGWIDKKKVSCHVMAPKITQKLPGLSKYKNANLFLGMGWRALYQIQQETTASGTDLKLFFIVLLLFIFALILNNARLYIIILGGGWLSGKIKNHGVVSNIFVRRQSEAEKKSSSSLMAIGTFL